MKLPNFSRQPLLLRATYHINTPMFVAGANQKEAELTPTTFKGVLRFWWRALNWSNIRLNGSDKIQALKTLHEKEAKLFGVASNDNKGGQGACFVNSLILNSERKWQYTPSSGVSYLLGQGLYHFRDGLTRQAFAHSQSFSVDLTVNNDSMESIIDVLKIIGLLGGFGSRSRHGFGSVTLTELQQKNIGNGDYQDVAFERDIKKSLKELLEKYRCRKNKELPPISAFYQGTRIDIITNTNKDSLAILENIGDEEQMYRSYGRNGKVGSKDAERNFKDDHDFALNMFTNTNNEIAHPKRVVFGLPHNYFYSGNSTRGHSANIDADTGRRASPLFRHMHQGQNGNYQAILCLLKSEFLHEQSKIDIVAKKDRDRKKQAVSAEIDWQVIEEFMNRFHGEIL